MQITSDALVFFGATGDLAHKKIFPALQRLAKRGKLEIPVVGVAKSGWNLQQLQERAKDSVENYGGLDAEGFPKLIFKTEIHRWRLWRPCDFRQVASRARCV